MNWKEEYKKRLTTPEEAVKVVKSNDFIVLPVTIGEPPALLEALANRKDRLQNVRVMHMVSLRPHSFFKPEMAGHFIPESWFLCGAARKAVHAQGSVTPNHFRDCPRLLSEFMNVDVFMAAVSRVDDHGFASLNGGMSYCRGAQKNAKKIVLEINNNLPRTLGDCFIHISEADYIVENHIPVPQLPTPPLTKEDEIIGQYIADLIEDGSTIQLGIGGIPNAVAKFLTGKHDLGVHSEMFTDTMVDLYDQGVITGRRKTLHPRKSIFTFGAGSQKLYDWVDNNPFVEVYPVDYVNDPAVISKNYKQVAINAALEVDLTGQCASEGIGPWQYSGTGGQFDFTRGAFLSPGGKAFTALYSTAKDGKVSCITPMLNQGATVTTPRTETNYVVTEYGVAQLKGKNFKERTEVLINIAHPDFRGELRDQAKKLGFLK